MRGRFDRFRGRTMAARPGDGGPLDLSPRSKRLVGWLAAIAVIGIVALIVRILGGNADGATVVPSPSAAASGAATITFGTALDPESGQVVETARTDRFVADDVFAYSVPVAAGRPDVVFVEVVRRADEETVQTYAEGEQPVPADRPAVGFTVPASALLEAFGPGTYRMRIAAAADAEPFAEGTFELLEAAPSGSP